jgi:hypothetical protein
LIIDRFLALESSGKSRADTAGLIPFPVNLCVGHPFRPHVISAHAIVNLEFGPLTARTPHVAISGMGRKLPAAFEAHVIDLVHFLNSLCGAA